MMSSEWIRKPLRFVPLLFILILSTSFSQLWAEEANFRARAHHDLSTVNSVEDVEAEIKFGKTIAARILGQFSLYEDKSLHHYVNLVGNSLAINSSRDDIQFHFAVLDSELINAYSTPGGYVFITKAAIRAMQDESELAAVLAHEIAHISQKHIVKEFKIKGSEKSATAGVTRLLGSSQSSTKVLFTKAVDNAVKKLLSVGFKEIDELEADKTALLLLASTGYDPNSLSRYLGRIKKLKTSSHGKHKPTHPPTNTRINTLAHIARSEQLDNLKFPRVAIRFAKYSLK